MHEWLKLPGLFLVEELIQVVEVDGAHEYLFEPAGRDDRRRALVAVYWRDHEPAPGSPLLDQKASNNSRCTPPTAAATSSQARACGDVTTTRE